MEWIVAVGVGLAMTRWIAGGYGPAGAKAWMRLPRVINPMLTGIAIVEGLVLAAESARRRGPERWGLGRWAWATSAIFLLVSGTLALFAGAAFRFVRLGKRIEPGPLVDTLAYSWRSAIGSTFALAFLAGALAFHLAGGPRDPSPDGREWSGRAFVGLIAAWTVAWRALEMLNR